MTSKFDKDDLWLALAYNLPLNTSQLISVDQQSEIAIMFIGAIFDSNLIFMVWIIILRMTGTFIVSSDNDNLMIIRSTNMKSSFLIVFHRSIINKVFASLLFPRHNQVKTLPFSFLIAVTKNILIKSKQQQHSFDSFCDEVFNTYENEKLDWWALQVDLRVGCPDHFLKIIPDFQINR